MCLTKNDLLGPECVKTKKNVPARNGRQQTPGLGEKKEKQRREEWSTTDSRFGWTKRRKKTPLRGMFDNRLQIWWKQNKSSNNRIQSSHPIILNIPFLGMLRFGAGMLRSLTSPFSLTSPLISQSALLQCVHFSPSAFRPPIRDCLGTERHPGETIIFV